MHWNLWHTAAVAPIAAIGLAVAAMAAPATEPATAADNTALVAQLRLQVQDQQAQISTLQGQLKVTMLDRVLFPEGGWRLGSAGTATLAKLVPTLRTLKDTRIAVDGFTDTMPIAAGYRDRFETNWELAGLRASAVVRYLVAQGVDPDRVVAVSHGERNPLSNNDTPAGRDQNRRIEVTLIGPGT